MFTCGIIKINSIRVDIGHYFEKKIPVILDTNNVVMLSYYIQKNVTVSGEV